MGLLKGNNAPYDTFLFRSAARPYTWVVVLVAFLVTAFMLKDPVEGQWDRPAL
ncbi:hypothetical protein [Sphingopyxis sp. LC363]|uniref:hypothetical protein n=1 Tax=Sphingopyxis sp. LC363 TaxID=1120705 RepID=UPI00050F9B5D|nr:hypothetical protein [Sphingopyxis sp. LC363]KGB51355.1 Major facilitator superfamily MFS_1 [Sphingopyxis sp. LC363]